MDSVFRRFPAALIVIYSIRSMFLGPQPVDIGILAVLGAIFAYCEFKTEQKTINSLKISLETLKERQTELDKTTNDLKTHVSSMKIGLGIKSNNTLQKF